MGAKTEIAWTDHTFNSHWGCDKVSPGCKNCYAETFSNRLALGIWGANAPRRFFGDKHWNEPRKWNAKAAKEGVRRRVFCASMADVFEDRRDLDPARSRLWDLIELTPALDWLLLTKRPEHICGLVPSRWWVGGFPPNVWIGVSVEDQKRADERIPLLLQVPAAVRFLSCEPLLEGVRLPGRALGRCEYRGHDDSTDDHYCDDGAPLVHWVIVGGESGSKARPFDVGWAYSLRDQCRAAGVPLFVKQLGSAPRCLPLYVSTTDTLRHRSGADPAEWPEDLRVQQFPEVPRG